MDIKEAELLARSLMDKHKLKIWKFEMSSRMKRLFGYCSYGRKKITLSTQLVELNDRKHVEQTILHEIAHALAFKEYGRNVGHSWKWKNIAKRIGHSGDRCYPKEVIQPKKKWKGECPSCGTWTEGHRRSRIACFSCCKKTNDGKFTEALLFVWTENN